MKSFYVALSHQGGWETDETDQQAAIREAIEEAGVRGKINVRSFFNLHFCTSCKNFYFTTNSYLKVSFK